MVCPQCGYDMGRAHRCLRCGFEVKTLAVVDEDAEEQKSENKEEEPSTVVIDPRNTYISSPDEDDGFGMFDPFDPFGSLFGGMFDPIGDILGGLFGFGRVSSGRRREEVEPEPEQKKRRKKGPIVEVNNVEILDADGNPIKEDKKESDGKKHSSKRDNNRK